MTVLCGCILAICTIVSLSFFSSQRSFIKECQAIDVDALKASNANEPFASSSKYLNERITYLLTSKKKKIIVDIPGFLSGINKYMRVPRRVFSYLFCMQLVLYTALMYFNVISYVVFVSYLAITVFLLILFLGMDGSYITSEIDAVEDIFRTIIIKFCILPTDYGQESVTAINKIDTKLNNAVNESKDYSKISDSLDKSMKTVMETIKEISKLVKDYSAVKATDIKDEVPESINKLKKKIEKIENLYAAILNDSRNKSESINKYIEFFNEYNAFYNEFENANKSLVELLNTIKNSKISTDEQVKEIQHLLHGIAAKQLNEVKSVVDVFVSDVFGRMSFVFSNNLQRTNQTLETLESLYRQGDETIKTINEYNKQISNTLADNAIHIAKINELISSNSQLVSFVLKRHKYIDTNVFNKLANLVGKSPIESTDFELDVLREKLRQLQVSVDSLGKTK